MRAKTKIKAERVGKSMIRPLLALERLSFLEPEGKVGYRYGRDDAERETMDYLEFIARVTSHIPDKGQVTVRYYGLYANAHRGVFLIIRDHEEQESIVFCPVRRGFLSRLEHRAIFSRLFEAIDRANRPEI